MAKALGEIGAAFLKLGLISFGGPIAHLGYFREEFVARRGWLNDETYVDLVALCQFLPGPASSQVAFALGMMRAGLAGAVAATVCFTLPSAVLLIAFAYGLSRASDLTHAGWLHGLKLAAVVVVAQAVWAMGRKLCTDTVRVSIGLGAAVVVLAAPGAWSQVGVIACGALLGRLMCGGRVREAQEVGVREKGWARGHAGAAAALAAFVVLLAALPLLASWSGSRLMAEFDSFYRSGALVFGGGHVVLPLLREEVVPRGWISDDAFLAGYGVAQAVPGPLFTFAAYLGTVMHAGSHAWLGGVWCLIAILLPAWLLIGGALPFWHRLRESAWAQGALRGANAAVVGVLLAALYTPVFTAAVAGGRDMAAVLAGFGVLQFWKAPPWAVVVGMAALGQWVL